MADAKTLIKAPDEKIKAFNQRIAQDCAEQYVTSIKLVIVDGQPAVTLLSEAEEATEEDVKQGLAQTEGDPVYNGPPCCAGVCLIKAGNGKQAEASEAYLDKLYTIADGAVIDVAFQSIEHYAWIEHEGSADTPPIYAPTRVTCGLVIWEIDEQDGDEDDEEQEEEEVEETEAPEKPPGKKARRSKKTDEATAAASADGADEDDE